MADDFIRRSEAMNKINDIAAEFLKDHTIQCDIAAGVAVDIKNDVIKTLPAADVVSSAVFEQIKRERDTALKTLEEHGIGLAQKSDKEELTKVPEYDRQQYSKGFNDGIEKFVGKIKAIFRQNDIAGREYFGIIRFLLEVQKEVVNAEKRSEARTERSCDACKHSDGIFCFSPDACFDYDRFERREKKAEITEGETNRDNKK